jgi:hypothetical protein
MTRAARSVYVFGVYLFVLAGGLLSAPNMLLGMFGLAPTNEVWIRVVGMLVALLGVYYTQAARAALTAFFRLTVPVRFSVPVFFTAFVLLGFAPAALILFGVVDALGAAWTAVALRSGA